MNEILLNKNKKYHKMILQLQLHEKEKLNVTAALHLEQIRKQDHLLSTGQDENEAGGTDRILSLLNDGILSSKRKVAQCIENINEILRAIFFK